MSAEAPTELPTAEALATGRTDAEAAPMPSVDPKQPEEDTVAASIRLHPRNKKMQKTRRREIVADLLYHRLVCHRGGPFHLLTRYHHPS